MTGVEWQIVRDTVGLPAAVSAGGLTIAILAARRWPRVRAPLVTLALALGFASAEIAIRGWDAVWPADEMRRLPHAALLVAAASVVRALLPFRSMTILLSVVVAAVVSGTFAQSGATAEFTSGEMAVWWCGLAAMFLASQLSLGQLAKHRGPASLSILWAGCVGSSAALLAASGSLSFGQVCGALAVCLTVLLVFAWRSPALSLHAGPAELVAVLLGSLIASGHFFSDLPRSAAVLMALSPHSAWLAGIPWVARRPWRGWVAQSVLALTLLGIAAGIIIAGRPAAIPAANPYGY